MWPCHRSRTRSFFAGQTEVTRLSLPQSFFQRALSTYCSQSIAFIIFNVLLALFVVRRLLFLIHFIEGIIINVLSALFVVRRLLLLFRLDVPCTYCSSSFGLLDAHQAIWETKKGSGPGACSRPEEAGYHVGGCRRRLDREVPVQREVVGRAGRGHSNVVENYKRHHWGRILHANRALRRALVRRTAPERVHGRHHRRRCACAHSS